MWWTDTEKVIDAPPPLIVYLDISVANNNSNVFSLSLLRGCCCWTHNGRNNKKIYFKKVGTSSFRLLKKGRITDRRREREKEIVFTWKISCGTDMSIFSPSIPKLLYTLVGCCCVCTTPSMAIHLSLTRWWVEGPPGGPTNNSLIETSKPAP